MSLNELLSTSDKLLAYSHAMPFDDVMAYHKVSCLIHDLCCHIRHAESDGMTREAIVAELVELRALHKKSAFIARLQSWPRGYQGDFETIEYLCDGISNTVTQGIEHYLERIALSSPIAQQHKNKVSWQSQQILRTLFEDPSDTPKKILSIGCGGCRDLRLIQPALKRAEVQIVINDIDAGAIEFSKNHLPDIWDRITPIQGDVFKRLREISRHAEFDLIVAGGLFDYLPDRHACRLLEKLMGMLKPEGKICFTNILTPNFWSVWVEYLADWKLIQRAPDEFREVFDRHGLTNIDISMEADATGLAGLYTLRKRAMA